MKVEKEHTGCRGGVDINKEENFPLEKVRNIDIFTLRVSAHQVENRLGSDLCHITFYVRLSSVLDMVGVSTEKFTL